MVDAEKSPSVDRPDGVVWIQDGKVSSVVVKDDAQESRATFDEDKIVVKANKIEIKKD